MPADTKRTIPVLIHVNPDDWAEFKRISGKRRASLQLRHMIRAYNAKLNNVKLNNVKR